MSWSPFHQEASCLLSPPGVHLLAPLLYRFPMALTAQRLPITAVVTSGSSHHIGLPLPSKPLSARTEVRKTGERIICGLTTTNFFSQNLVKVGWRSGEEGSFLPRSTTSPAGYFLVAFQGILRKEFRQGPSSPPLNFFLYVKTFYGVLPFLSPQCSFQQLKEGECLP